MKKNKSKLKQAIPGIIACVIFTSSAMYGILNNRKCKKALKQDELVVELVRVKTSERKYYSRKFSTITYYDSNVTKFHNTLLSRVAPKGFPIYVEYSKEHPECYRFLWDSVIVDHGYRIKYFYVKNEGFDFEYNKLEE